MPASESDPPQTADPPITRAEFAELRALTTEARDLADAALVSICGTKKRETYIQSARDHRWITRYMREPFLRKIIGHNASDALMVANSRGDGEGAPDKGYMNLQEIAAAGRATIAAVKGVGPKAMEKLDRAVKKHKLAWADAGCAS